MAKIIGKARVALLERDDQGLLEEVSNIEIFNKLNGLALDEGPVSDYLQDGDDDEQNLYKLGLRGGTFKLILEEETQSLVCLTEFDCPTMLNEEEQLVLRGFLYSQYLDGVGENGSDVDLSSKYSLGFDFDEDNEKSIQQYS